MRAIHNKHTLRKEKVYVCLIVKIEINIMQIDSTTNLVVYIYKRWRMKKKKIFREKQNTITIDKQHLEKKKEKMIRHTTHTHAHTHTNR